MHPSGIPVCLILRSAGEKHIDNKRIRATTKETQFDLALNKAKELLVEAA